MTNRIARPVKMERLSDIPQVPMTLSDTLVFKTGSWRYVQPLYENKTSPCNEGCPAGVNIQEQMRLVAEGKFHEAAVLFRQEHPLPSVTGRTCFHPCETACNRAKFDSPLAINAIERRIGDEALKFQTENPNKGTKKEKIAVIGSGPSGLTCAFYMAMMGYNVTIYEKMNEPGGVLRYGIPSYRLPKDILAREIDNIRGVGVEIKCGQEIGKNVSLDELKSSYDAVYIATGVWKSKPLRVEGEDHPAVMSGLEFLAKVNAGETVKIGPKVAIVGGGNTAMDACRTCLRLGLEPVIVYRRTRAEMPAIPEEIDEAEAEGIPFEFLTAPLGFEVKGDKLTGMKCQRMKLGRPDESGRRRPEPIEGSEFVMPVDTVLAAIGEDPDLAFLGDTLELKWNKIVTGNLGSTTDKKLFAGGDVIDQDHTVVHAIGAGKKAAIAIDSTLNGVSADELIEKIRVGAKGSISTGKFFGTCPQEAHDVVTFNDLNVDYFDVVPRAEMPHLTAGERTSSFNEVNKGIGDEAAIAEAKRCFNCGSCISCDNCILFCPDIAVMRALEEGDAKGVGKAPYFIDYEYCKGCLVCVHECPRSAMSFEEVIR